MAYSQNETQTEILQSKNRLGVFVDIHLSDRHTGNSSLGLNVPEYPQNGTSLATKRLGAIMCRSFIFLLLLVSQHAFAILEGMPLALIPSSIRSSIQAKAVRLVVQSEDGIFPFCSGYLSSSNQVVTAGHCLAATSGKKIFAEIYDSQTGRYTRIPVKESIGSETDNFDIGMLTLEQNVSPAGISLPMVHESACDSGRPLFSAGFGTNNQGEAGNLNVAQYLRESTIDMQTIRGAERLVPNSAYLRPSGRAQVCHGDSGGPVFCMVKGSLSVVGVNSSIRPRMFTLAPGEYNRLKYCQMSESLRVSAFTQIPDLERTRQTTLEVESADLNVAN